METFSAKALEQNREIVNSMLNGKSERERPVGRLGRILFMTESMVREIYVGVGVKTNEM